MANTVRTAVVLIPPRDVWPPIQAIRAEHDRHYRRWMPHVTLLYPFRPRDDWAAVLEPLSGACARIEPFEVRLTAFARFRHRGSQTLWLVPEPKAQLVALHTALWRAVPGCDDTRQRGGGFTPHLSVGQAPDAQAEALLARLYAGWEPITFLASEVQLIWRNEPPDDAFRVGDRIGLATAPGSLPNGKGKPNG